MSDRFLGQVINGLVALIPFFLGAGVGMFVVDRETRAPCTTGQSLVRNLILAVLGPIDWIFIFGDQHQRLGDKAANTIVIPA